MRLAVTPEQSEQEDQDEQWMSYTDEGFDFSFGELLPPSPEEQIAADAAQAEAQDVDLKKTEDAMFEAAGEQNPYDGAVEGTAKQKTGSDARQGSQEAVEQGQAATGAGEPANATEPVSEPTPAVPSQTEGPEAQTSVSAEATVPHVAEQEPVAEPQQEAAIQPTAEQQDSQKVEQAQEPASGVGQFCPVRPVRRNGSGRVCCRNTRPQGFTGLGVSGRLMSRRLRPVGLFKAATAAPTGRKAATAAPASRR